MKLTNTSLILSLFALIVAFLVNWQTSKQKQKISLYTPVDTMNCSVTYLVNNRPQHNQKGYMILMGKSDTLDIKAFVVDSTWKTIDCNSILELDVNPD